MRIALYHIFKKNGIFLLSLLLCFIGIKIFTMYNISDSMKTDALNIWISQCDGLDYKQISQYISTLGSDILTNEEVDRSIVNQYSKFNSSYRNYKNVNNLISFSKIKEGELPTKLPPNYMEQLDFYQKLNPPKLINEESVSKYFKLQEFSVMPILVIILIAFFSGSYYETEMYKVSIASPNGKKFNKYMITIIVSICVCLLFINEFFDLCFSGLLIDRITMQASIQSYSLFANSQINLSMLKCLTYIFLCKILGLLVLTEIVYCFAKKHKNTKDTLITSLGFLLICFLIGKALSETPYSSLFQLGIVNWEAVVKNISISSFWDTNTMFLGTMLMAIISTFFYVFIAKSHRKML